MEEAQNRVNVKLAPCNICGRKFAVDRLAKHTKACKIASKKRKAFDETLMRAGDDQEMLQKAKEAKKLLEIEKKQKEKQAAQKNKGFPANAKKDWQKESEAFRAQIKAARGGKISDQDKMVIEEVAKAGMVDCVHCGRSFGQKAAERHIPVCANKMKNTANRMNTTMKKPTVVQPAITKGNIRKARY